jgi:hypothetical protein
LFSPHSLVFVSTNALCSTLRFTASRIDGPLA